MTRFLVAAAGAVALGLGMSSTANAQLVYGYSVPVYGGVQTSEAVMTPFGTQTFSNFYSPFTFNNATVGATYTPYGVQGFSNFYSPFGGGVGRTFTSNPFTGTTVGNYGYNPWNGLSYGATITRPFVTSPAYGFGGPYWRRR